MDTMAKQSTHPPSASGSVPTVQSGTLTTTTMDVAAAESMSMSMALAALPTELAELVVIPLIRIHAAATLWADRSAITSPLNLLPRSIAPRLTQAALINLPEFDMNSASLAGDVSMLDFMYAWSKQANGKGRPMQYTCNAPIVPPARPWEGKRDSRPLSVMDQVSAKPGLVHVLDWWWRKSDVLVVNWTETAVDAAAANGDLDTLEWWWTSTGSLAGGQRRWFRYSQKAVDDASGKGHVRVLGWFVDTVGSRLGKLAVKYSVMAMAQAAANGHLHVLKWWVEESGLQLQARAIMDAAASTGRMDVLEWCLTQPQVLEQVQFGGIGKYDCFLSSAIRQGNRKLMSWFEERVPVQVRSKWTNSARPSCAAAMIGDLFAIQWLLDRGWLRGTRHELVARAAHSGKSDVVDWLHQNVPSDNQAIGWIPDEFSTATRKGNLKMLDCLLSHGYKPWANVCYFITASSSGKASVMDWWFKYKGDFDRDDLVNVALTVAVRKRYFDVLDWWLTSGSDFMSADFFDEYWELLQDAGAKGDVEMIRWWCELVGRDLAFLLRDAVIAASGAGHVAVLEYYAENRGYLLDSDDTASAIAKASDSGRIECLDWWFNHVVDGSGDMTIFLRAFAGSFRHAPGGKSLLWWTQVFRIQDYGIEADCTYRRFKETADLVQLVGSLDSAYSLFLTIRYDILPKPTVHGSDQKLPVQEIFYLQCSHGTVAQVDYIARSLSGLVVKSQWAVQEAAKSLNLSVLEWFLKLFGHDFLQNVLQTAGPLLDTVSMWWESVNEPMQ